MDRGDKSFTLTRIDELVYLQALLFKSGGLVEHAFSTRLGGCSSGKLASLNMAYHNGDSNENVFENRRRFFNLFEADYRQIVAASQVHGTAIAVFGHKHKGEGALPHSAARHCDALVTSEPGLILSAYAADCQLLYFCAPEYPLVAVVHAGKQGTLGSIGPLVVNFLTERYHVKTERLLVAMSPNICRFCYQIGSEEADIFRQAGWSGRLYMEPAAEGRFKLDLGAINLEQLLTAGIDRDNIAISGLCTSCNPDLFYSYRRDRGNTGRMIGFIALKSNGTG